MSKSDFIISIVALMFEIMGTCLLLWHAYQTHDTKLIGMSLDIAMANSGLVVLITHNIK